MPKKQKKKSKNNSDLSILGLLLSLGGILTCGITSLIGIVVSSIALSRTDELEEKDAIIALIGLVAGIIVLIFLFNFLSKVSNPYGIS